MQGAVHRADQQGQRAGTRTVGDQDADAAPVRVDAGQLLGDERGDLALGQHPVRSPDAGDAVPGDAGHPAGAGRLRRAHSYEMRCDSSFDSTLGSSTSIMKSPS